jgi:predicted nucleic acid-binding protein
MRIFWPMRRTQTPRSTRHHALCWKPARDPSITLYVTSQILCELYSVITNPRRVAVTSSPTEALRIISAMLALPGLLVLPIPACAVAGWMELLQRHPVTGGDVFDLQIVATMQANGVQRIYTFNADDFDVFSSPGLPGCHPPREIALPRSFL